MIQRTGDIATGASMIAISAFAGWLYASTGMALLIGGVVGVAAAALAWWLQMRPLPALAVTAATAVGVLVGQSIVRVLCLPDECPGLEVTAAVVTGVGALVGVGLVVALVMRSFEEFRAARSAPPEGDSAQR